jgi:SpoVK/Ycf46/Vps4 family AAA+-type ATPase
VGPDTEIFAPTELFVLLADPQRRRRYNAVIRVHETDQGFVILEIATPIAASSEHLLAELTATAAAQSIFRNRTVRVVPGANTRSAYEEDSGTAPLDLAFVAEQPVTADAIIFEPGMQELLDRTVVDFHHRRAELVALGLPARRGVLFYGPPGTGKTFTCKYLIHRLQPVTTLVATGNALYQIAAICAIAQTLQPALVLLEDVDLVFTDRAQNSTPTLLGEFFDALDGFSSDDAVIFVLTTNALERVEGAIKDRPGRISQCLFFGPPSSPLRQRYLDTLLKPYGGSSINLARIVARTEGVSQAFLKELVFRAVQIASARAADERNHGAVHDDDLAQALTDMTIAAGPGGRRIIGFQAS